MNTKKILKTLKEMSILERYEAISQFRQGAFKVLNPAIPQMVKQDILLSIATLEMLKDVKPIIEDDIEKLKLENISIKDILATHKKIELSDFIANNVYLRLRGILERDFNAYQKAERLNKVYPLETRKAELNELKAKIESLQQSIEVLVDLDADLVRNQVDKLEELRNRKEAIERTIDYKTEEEIKLEIYGCTYGYLKSVLDNVQANIDHIERNL